MITLLKLHRSNIESVGFCSMRLCGPILLYGYDYWALPSLSESFIRVPGMLMLEFILP